jgi:CspA family cold shock protein
VPRGRDLDPAARQLCASRDGGSIPTGSVNRIVAERGFGFIAADDGKEYFFHRSGLDPSLDFDRLAGGERVDFAVENSAKGPRATRVRPAP